MLTWISVFFPALFASFLVERISKKRLCAHDFFCLWATNALGINFVCCFIKRYVFHSGMSPIENMTPQAAFSYLAVAVPVAVVLAGVEALFRRNPRLSVEGAQK